MRGEHILSRWVKGEQQDLHGELGVQGTRQDVRPLGHPSASGWVYGRVGGHWVPLPAPQPSHPVLGESQGRPSPWRDAWCVGHWGHPNLCVSRIRVSLGAGWNQPPPRRLKVMVWTWPSEGQRRLWLHAQSSLVPTG